MKKLLPLIVALVILSCTNNRKNPIHVARLKVESELLKTLHDPDSYEFVDFMITDTLWNRKSWTDTSKVSIKKIQALIKYRANNKLGNKVLDIKLVDLDGNGDVQKIKW